MTNHLFHVVFKNKLTRSLKTSVLHAFVDITLKSPAENEKEIKSKQRLQKAF